MKKILFVEDRSRRRFVLRTALKLFNYETYIVSADKINGLIEEEAPDFIFLNIKEAADGEDMKSLFENLRSGRRLRVRIVNTGDHKLKFGSLLPFEKFDDAVNGLSEKFYKTILRFRK